MHIDPLTTAAADSYWAHFFDLDPLEVVQPETRVVPHAELADYNGIFFWHRDQTLIVSVPNWLPASIAVQLVGLNPSDFGTPDALFARIPLPIERIIGPAYIGYADLLTFKPRRHAEARMLTTADLDAYTTFRSACSDEDWNHGGNQPQGEPLAGLFHDGQLLALGGYELWGNQIAHLTVVTHPQARGRGYGAAVVSLAAEAALVRGLAIQYRTLYTNIASMHISNILGFRHYADTLAVRLAAPE